MEVPTILLLRWSFRFTETVPPIALAVWHWRREASHTEAETLGRWQKKPWFQKKKVRKGHWPSSMFRSRSRLLTSSTCSFRWVVLSYPFHYRVVEGGVFGGNAPMSPQTGVGKLSLISESVKFFACETSIPFSRFNFGSCQLGWFLLLLIGLYIQNVGYFCCSCKFLNSMNLCMFAVFPKFRERISFYFLESLIMHLGSWVYMNSCDSLITCMCLPFSYSFGLKFLDHVKSLFQFWSFTL